MSVISDGVEAKPNWETMKQLSSSPGLATFRTASDFTDLGPNSGDSFDNLAVCSLIQRFHPCSVERSARAKFFPQQSFAKTISPVAEIIALAASSKMSYPLTTCCTHLSQHMWSLSDAESGILASETRFPM